MKTLFRSLLSLLLLAPACAATQVFDGVNQAENQLASSNGRWFISSDGALYEGKYDGRAYSKRAIPARLSDGSSHACYFLGMAERSGKLYALCKDSSLNPLSTTRLFRLDLNDVAGELREIYRPSGMALPNGMVAAADGSLIAADSGAPLLPGKLVRFSVDGAGVVTAQSTLHQFPLCKANGLRLAGDQLYVSLNPTTLLGVSQLKRYRLLSNGIEEGATLYTSWQFIDDFALTSDGAVVAEFLGGKVSHVSEGGLVLKSASFSQPTSILASRGGMFPAGAITVTERNTGRVMLDGGFGAWPR